METKTKLPTPEELADEHDLSETAREIFLAACESPGAAMYVGQEPKSEDRGNVLAGLEIDDYLVFQALYELAGKSMLDLRGRLSVKIIRDVELPTRQHKGYAAYLASPEWKTKAEAAKERAGQRCQTCNVHRSQMTLDAHHRTYERVGRELDSDLVVLCRKCHEIFHQNTKPSR